MMAIVNRVGGISGVRRRKADGKGALKVLMLERGRDIYMIKDYVNALKRHGIISRGHRTVQMEKRITAD